MLPAFTSGIDELIGVPDEGLDLQLGKQAVDLAVRELRALDAGRGADALDRGHLAQGLEPARRDRPERAPGPLNSSIPAMRARISGVIVSV